MIGNTKSNEKIHRRKKKMAMLAILLSVVLCVTAFAVSYDKVEGSDATVGSTFVASTDEGVVVTYRVISDSPAKVQVGNDAVAINTGTTGKVTIPSTVTNSSTTYSVTSIGVSAFTGCNVLTSVIIPSSVTSIGENAFYNCNALASVNIPEGVTSIEDDTFWQCTALTSITIPSSVTSIGGYAFTGTALTSITIPSSVTSIGTHAFYGCSALTSITMPDGVTSIGGYAFYNCSNLTDVYVTFQSSAITIITNGVIDTYFDTSSSWKLPGQDRTIQELTLGIVSTYVPTTSIHGENGLYLNYDSSGVTSYVYITSAWVLTAHTVTFVGNYSSSTYSEAVTENYGSAYILPTTDPTRTGYTFAGWYTTATGDTQVTTSTIVAITSTNTVYAHWTANTYAVTFVGNYSSSTYSEEVTENYGSAYILPTTDPTRTGYTFAGWYTTATGDTQVTTSTVVNITSPITLYAHWTAIAISFPGDTVSAFYQNVYTRTYVATGGSGSFTYTNTTPSGDYGPYVSNFTFSSDGTVSFNVVWTGGFYLTIKATDTVTGLSVTSTFHINVTYYGDAATPTATPSAGAVDSGTSISLSSTSGSARIYYSVDGGSNYTLYTGLITVTSAVTIYAYALGGGYSQSSTASFAYSIAAYSVTYDANGGNGVPVDGTDYYKNDTVTVLFSTIPVRTGYTFEGWAKTSTASSPDYTSGGTTSFSIGSANVILYAVWSLGTYTVTESETHSSISITSGVTSGNATYGTDIVFTASADSHCENLVVSYSVGGGSYTTLTVSGGSYTISGNMITGAISIRSVATLIDYAVTFVGNYTGSTYSVTVTETYGDSYVLPATDPSRTDYVFAGWYTSSLGGTQVTSATMVLLTSDMTLYAHWTASTVTYTVTLTAGDSGVTGFTYTINGGSSHTYISAFTVNYGSDLVITAITATGYQLSAWSGYVVSTDNPLAVSDVHSNVSLTAVSEIDTCTVTFVGNYSDSTYSIEMTETYGSDYVLPSSEPTRSGYIFAGWYTASSEGTQVTTSTVVLLTSDTTLYAHWTPNTGGDTDSHHVWPLWLLLFIIILIVAYLIYRWDKKKREKQKKETL